MRKLSFLFFFLILCIQFQAFAQAFSRIKADFSIKSKDHSGNSQLTMGKVYFDRNFGKLSYINSFPQRETNVVMDTVIFHLTDGKVKSKMRSPVPLKFSVFSLLLNGELQSFGLEKSGFEATKTEKEKDLVITTWIPRKELKTGFGKILISTKDKKLFGIAIFSKEDKVITKQFFKNYINVKGLDVPTEIVQIIYDIAGNESYQMTTYKNLKVNDFNEDNIYNFPLPH